MIKKLLLMILLCAMTVSVFAQNAPFAVMDVESQNPTALKITIKTFANKKKEAQHEAIYAALNVLLFEGLPGTAYSSPLLPLSAKREASDYVNDLFTNRTSDFVRSVTQMSDFHKAAANEKSTIFDK